MLNVRKGAELGLNIDFASEGLAAFASQSSEKWYAIWTRSNFEQRTDLELTGKGFSTYLPGSTQVRQWKDRRKALFTPFFPGYLFARFTDTPENRAHVLRTSGVVRLLGTGPMPEQVPDSEVEAVKRLTSSPKGCFVHPFLTDGCPVRVRRGPLKGLEGLFVRQQGRESRLVIQVNLLGQAVATELDASDVDPIHGLFHKQSV